VLKQPDGKYAAWNRWGRVGEEGEHKLYPDLDEAAAVKRFKDKFKDKTLNTYDNYKAGTFEKKHNKYDVLETEEGGEGAEQAPLGKLTAAQIGKGMAVIDQLKEAVGAGADPAIIGNLSSQYYTYIPTMTKGRQRPPELNTMDLIGAKESLLLFWMKMGFSEVAAVKPADKTKHTVDNPIEGLLERPLPPTLKAACDGKISDPGSIASSVKRGDDLSKKKTGNPIKPMNQELYGSIILYTGNSIYRALNQALRVEHQNVPKYLSYLRLLFEAMDCMPRQSGKLWRGIAADLYDEYEPGKEIIWWTVSSCTSAQHVAEGFMNQLGGTATLMILDVKTALDIMPISIYPHECESLLKPGIRLKVLSREKKGQVNHIHVEEVGNVLDK
jgi:predicted DNA-binding WGR domain protein